MKTVNTRRTKPNKTEASFNLGSHFMPSGQETDRTNSTAARTRTGVQMQK